MAKYTSTIFVGHSGKEYKTIVFPFKTTFKAGIGGVYIVTKRVEAEGKVTHEPFFVGSGHDIAGSFKFHPMSYQFNKYEVNTICVIKEAEEVARKEIYTDLLHKYMPLLNEFF